MPLAALTWVGEKIHTFISISSKSWGKNSVWRMKRRARDSTQRQVVFEKEGLNDRGKKRDLLLLHMRFHRPFSPAHATFCSSVRSLCASKVLASTEVSPLNSTLLLIAWSSVRTYCVRGQAVLVKHARNSLFICDLCACQMRLLDVGDNLVHQCKSARKDGKFIFSVFFPPPLGA